MTKMSDNNKKASERLDADALGKRSLVCVGLDPEFGLLPQTVRNARNPVIAFNRAIIDATLPYAIAYKPNLAFYECLGQQGWEALADIVQYVEGRAFVIADAKRGDIGNTARRYAEAFFQTIAFDAITVNPYMGLDTLGPYLAYPGKMVFVLGLTSNPGAADFELLQSQGRPVFTHVMEKASKLAGAAEIAFVAGATQPEWLHHVRLYAPAHWLLMPGIGAQGGGLANAAEMRSGPSGRVLVNSARGIIYASQGPDFAEAAAHAAKQLAAETAQAFCL